MKSLPVKDAIDHYKRTGYDNIELCLIKDFPPNSENSRRQSNARCAPGSVPAGARRGPAEEK